MASPVWLDEHGKRVPTRPCHVAGCTREWPVRRYRFEHLPFTGWPTQPMVVVNWCGHGQEFVPWPEADGLWALVPVVEAVANQLRADEPSNASLVDSPTD